MVKKSEVKKSASTEPITISVERDLRKNIRTINQRFNDNPDIAKLIVVNPILALEDIGIKLSPDVKAHIMERLHFPPKLRARRDELESELTEEFENVGLKFKPALTNTERAEFTYKILKKTSLLKHKDHKKSLSKTHLREYKNENPILEKLIEYEHLKSGALIFHPKETYNLYKTGVKKHRWIKKISFKM